MAEVSKKGDGGGEDRCKANVAFSKVTKNNHANKTKALPYPDPTHTTTQDITLIGDSGATDLFVTQADARKNIRRHAPMHGNER